MTELSDDPRDKLRACLNHDRPDVDDDLGLVYRDACGAWFARLTQGERWRLAMVLAAYDRGSEADAEQLAAVLPPAPKFPLQGLTPGSARARAGFHLRLAGA